MKKMVCGVSMCSIFLSLMGMEVAQYIPLDDLAVYTAIESYEGLCVLAQQMRNNEEPVEKYEVLPAALVDYVLRNEKEQCEERTRQAAAVITKLKDKNVKKFNMIVQEVLQECVTKKSSDDVLTQMQEKFGKISLEDKKQLDDDVDNALLTYKGISTKRLIATVSHGMYGAFLVGSVTAIGLFSWVIDHCHHPWD